MIKSLQCRREKAISLSKYASKYAESGYPVLPMHAITNGQCTCGNIDCQRPGKHPRVSGGVNAATTDTQQVGDWWLEWPDSNIGVATGKKGDVIVLDVDPRNGGSDTLKKMESVLGPLPSTIKVKTGGGGVHFYFRAPGLEIKSDTAGKVLGPGLDVLSDGKISIAPPSLHVSGSRYLFAKNHNPFKGAVVAELPLTWLARLRQESPAAPIDGTIGTFDVEQKIPEGQRNTKLASIAGYLVNTGLSPDGVFELLLMYNQKRCSPPLAATEVKQIAESIESYRSSDALVTPNAVEYKALAIVLAEHFAGGKHLRYLSGHDFHVYDGRLWNRVDTREVKKKVLATIESFASVLERKPTAILSDVMQLLEIKQLSPADLLYGDKRVAVINCRNGEVWIGADGTATLKPHSPESNLTFCLPIDYDPKAKCPKYDAALRQIFGAAKDPNDMARHFNEVFGYLIQPYRNIPLILILLGAGSNGKTELWMTLTNLIGKDFIHSGSLGQLDSNRFIIGFLRGKMLFVDDDIKAGAKLPDGVLKKISEPKLLSGELKGRDAFQFTNLALPVLLANNEPTTSDLSHGLRRRIMVIPFKHEFKVGIDLDRALWPSIRKTEMSGVLNRMIKGLQRLRKRGSEFKLPVDVVRAKESWYRNANPLQRFLAERTKRLKAHRCLVSDFYSAYTNWASQNGINYQLQRNTLKRQLSQLNYNIGSSGDGSVIIGLSLEAVSQNRKITGDR